MVTCISAGGDHMIPLLVSSQVTDAVVWKPKTKGLGIGIDILFKKRDRPYMNAALFNEYTSIVLLPHTARVRSNPRLENEPVALLMDDCSVQMRNDILKNLPPTKSRLSLSHLISQIRFGALVFWVSKKRMNFKLPLEDDDSTTVSMSHIFTI
jgi:hypothetical protein